VRVADTSLSLAITEQLNQQESSIATLEEQVSSGKALNKPSDDPAAVTQVLQLSGQASQLSNWQNNVQTATSWFGMGNNAVNSTLSNMQSARSLLLQALNQGTQDSTTYQAIGQQLQGITANLLSTANTQFEGRPIFAGTSASSQAYDSAGTYLGNSDTPNVIVGPGPGSGQAAALSVSGPSVFGTGAANVFNTLSTVAGQLGSGAPTAAQLNAALNALDANITTAEQASAVFGNGSDQVTALQAALTTQLTEIQGNQASLEDVNVATVTTQLDSEMTNYQAAMWAASKAIPETPVHFL
jgi:flagellar hook-associated protein 3 FlgL